MPSRHKKRQARLQFTPLPSSSPASANYSQQIRDRAAAVGYEGSPSRTSTKRRKITDMLAQPTPSSGLPPVKASKHKTITIDSSDSDDSLPRLSQVRASVAKRKRDSLTLSTGARGSSPPSKAGSSPLPTPDSGAFFRKPKDLKRDSAGRTRSTRSKAPAQFDGASDDDATPTQAPPKASDNFVDLGSDGDSDSDEIVTPARKRARTQHDSDEEDVRLPKSSGRLKRNRLAPEVHTVESSEDERVEEVESSDDELPKSATTRRGLRNGRQPAREADHASEDDEDEQAEEVVDDEPQKPKGHVLSVEEQQELDDDVNDLRTSSPELEEARPRRKPNAQTERMAALERLKQRRAGIKTQEVINVDEDEEDDEVMEVSDDEGAENDYDDDDELHDHNMPQSSAHDVFDANEEDEEFLDDDDNGPLGVPEGLPLAFTRYASLKPKELFHYAVEWMVQKKLNPGFNGTDEIYNLTFNKLDDEVKGLAGSKFESSAWRPEFLYALRARPQIAANKMDRNDAAIAFKEKCDACNRSGHMPTFEVQFQGRPYHGKTLEDVEDPEDEDSEADIDDDAEEVDKDVRDARGNVILPQSHSFFVGKFCMANTETAHALQHWRYHLYEWVVEWLQTEGHLADQQIVRRDRWGEPKRRKYANKVVDGMDDSGKIKELYRNFKDEVSRARDAKIRTWDRSSP